MAVKTFEILLAKFSEQFWAKVRQNVSAKPATVNFSGQRLWSMQMRYKNTTFFLIYRVALLSLIESRALDGVLGSLQA